jgi:hypothetical protein
VTPRTGFLLAGVVAVVMVAIAGVLFLQGESLAAIKLVTPVVLVPGMAAFGFAAVAGALVLLGPVVILLPFQLYLPWAPASFSPSEMPFGLPILMWLGVALLYVGGAPLLVLAARDKWREREWMDLIGLALVAAWGVSLALGVLGANT